MSFRRRLQMSEPVHYINVHAANTNLVGRSILGNTEYSTQIVCDEGYSIYEITIKMGGVDITSTAFDPTYNMISIASVTDDVDIECYAMHTMPSDYVRVDGIKNPSNAYLNTGYTCNKYSRTETRTNIVRNYQFIACSRSTGNAGMQGTGFVYYSNALYSFSATAVVLQKGYNLVGNTYTLVQDNYLGYCYVDGVRGSKYTKSGSDTYPIHLFSRQGGGDATGSEGQILPYFRIYDYATASYVRYYIPCLNDSGVAGFWDAARGVFQGSSNSTAFQSVAST